MAPSPPDAGSAPLLKVSDLVVHYGAAQVLHGVSLELKAGEVVGLLGSNGAGKSTLLMAISGVVRPTAGRVSIQGRDITRNSPESIVKLGISHVAEGRRVFRLQSVLSNLELGAYTISHNQSLVDRLNVVLDLFPVLRTKQNVLAAQLSGGEQQMLAIAQALMADPSLLLMDEPSAGLAPIVVRSLLEKIQQLKEEGLTVLLVEQAARLALAACDRLYLLRNGRIIVNGVRSVDVSLDQIRAAYI